MERCDVAVIGAGLLGCMAARSLGRYALRTVVLEQREDVCTGVSRANTAIVYSGCDAVPGTEKAALNAAAARRFPALCAELGVRFSRCGSLMTASGPCGEAVVRARFAQGLQNGTPGLRLLSGAEARALEPALPPETTLALLAPTAGTVNPWELCIAAFENARANGAEFRFETAVHALRREDGRFRLETGRGALSARCVLNCAGLSADRVRELLLPPRIRLFPDTAEYLLLDEGVPGAPAHIVLCETEDRGKGLTMVPTVDGNLLLGPVTRPFRGDENSEEGLAALEALCRAARVPLDRVIRRFAAARPNPYEVLPDGQKRPDARPIVSFPILAEDGLWSLVGIKTPGLTCAAELGGLLAEQVVRFLGGAAPNPDFSPLRPAPLLLSALSLPERARLAAADPACGRIVCRCRGVSEREVRNAIASGASTPDGVRRRTGCGTGRCQGGFCTRRILQLLEEAHG